MRINCVFITKTRGENWWEVSHYTVMICLFVKSQHELLANFHINITPVCCTRLAPLSLINSTLLFHLPRAVSSRVRAEHGPLCLSPIKYNQKIFADRFSNYTTRPKLFGRNCSCSLRFAPPWLNPKRHSYLLLPTVLPLVFLTHMGMGDSVVCQGGCGAL